MKYIYIFIIVFIILLLIYSSLKENFYSNREPVSGLYTSNVDKSKLVCHDGYIFNTDPKNVHYLECPNREKPCIGSTNLHDIHCNCVCKPKPKPVSIPTPIHLPGYICT